eukprot:CAMPEP_0197851056 /NCGR_PEP_ID=MMETSP1438-20131217/17151_1 /TAXON_ID=1461541 /ORGANISM="Pterosperma sp., Strain CCMP1384" /LENGTH=70 /DNA_ID=CAMNT_0043464519 /DNA_START=301 /DNA_END=513 /DNA_ORIENTATION=-
MAIDFINEVFPCAEVTWARKDPRVSDPRIVVSTSAGVEVADVRQYEMSDDYVGPAVEQLRSALKTLKQSI